MNILPFPVISLSKIIIRSIVRQPIAELYVKTYKGQAENLANTTGNIYSHVTPKTKEKAANKMDSILKRSLS